MHYTVGPGSNNKLRLVAIRSLVETLIILQVLNSQYRNQRLVDLKCDCFQFGHKVGFVR
jgi:hypothetical protein